MRRRVRPEQGTIPAPKSRLALLVAVRARSILLCLPVCPGAASPPRHRAHHVHQAGFQVCTQQIHPCCGFRATPWALYVLPEPSKGCRKRGCLFSLACPSIAQHQRAAAPPTNPRGYPPAAKRASAMARYACLLPRNRTGEGEEQIGDERSG